MYSQVFFDVIVNGIVFLISLSDSSLFVYKNTTNFWIFIFYSALLLNLFISSSSFCSDGIFRVLYIQKKKNAASWLGGSWLPRTPKGCRFDPRLGCSLGGSRSVFFSHIDVSLSLKSIGMSSQVRINK